MSQICHATWDQAWPHAAVSWQSTERDEGGRRYLIVTVTLRTFTSLSHLT